MKRAILVAAMVLFSFALGWVCAVVGVRNRDASLRAILEEQQASSIASIRQQIYGANYFHKKGIVPEDDARLATFRAADSKGLITLSYLGGMGRADTHLQVQGDGSVTVIQHGTSRKVATLDAGRCQDFFRQVITSGLANYSEAVIEMKRDLSYPSRTRNVHDAPDSEFRIHVPELGIDKSFSIFAPSIELENYPDIVEYRRITDMEKEILSFVPKEDPFWK